MTTCYLGHLIIISFFDFINGAEFNFSIQKLCFGKWFISRAKCAEIDDVFSEFLACNGEKTCWEYFAVCISINSDFGVLNYNIAWMQRARRIYKRKMLLYSLAKSTMAESA